MKRLVSLLLALFLLLPFSGWAEEPEEWPEDQEDWESWEDWDEAEDAADWVDWVDWEDPDEEEIPEEDVLTSGDFTYVVLEDSTCAITGWTGTEDHLAIPGSLEGLRVTALADNAFAEAEMTSVSIPAEVTTVGANPFVACLSLVSFDLPEDHPTLYADSGLLFSRDDRRLITYAPGLQEGACVLPAGTLAVGDDAFAWCEQLVRVQLCQGLTEIGSGAFAMCTGLTGIDLPDSIGTIGPSAFAGSGLERIVLPMRLMVLQDRVFFGCEALSDIWMPPGLTAIEDEVFGGCSMERITLPTEISYLGVNPFVGCDSLTEIVLPQGHPVYAMEGSLLMDRSEMNIIACLTGVIGEFDIPEGVVSVGDYAFFGCSELTDIHFPSTLRRIGSAGFSSCMTCTSLVLNDGLEAIGDLAFSDCFLLEDIRIPRSVTELGEELFDSCGSLQAVHAEQDSAVWAWCRENLVPVTADTPEE